MGKCEKCGQELGLNRASQHFCTTLGNKSVQELKDEQDCIFGYGLKNRWD